MEEVQGQCGIDIALGAPEESNIVVSRVDKAHARKLDDGCLFRGFRSNNLVAKVQYFISTKKMKKKVVTKLLKSQFRRSARNYLPDIVTEPSIYEYITFLVANNYGTGHLIFDTIALN